MFKPIITSIGDFCCILVNLLYPQNCLICSQKIPQIRPSPVCRECGDKIEIESKACLCRQNINASDFDNIFYATRYDDAAKKCVCLLKYEGKTQLAAFIGNLMTDFACASISREEIDAIVPVPLHPVRQRERRFNQSELIAQHIARKLNKELLRNGLRKIKNTPPQAGLDKTQRLKNLKGAFTVDKADIFKDKSVLVIDDVLTTGATFYECARTLEEAGARRTTAFVFARGG